MNLRKLFDLSDVNYWLLVSGFALDAVLTVIVLISLLQFLAGAISTVPMVQVALMLGVFICNFATGWIIGKMSDDLKGPTYGVIGSLSSVLILLVVIVPAGGVFGLLAAVVALAGGLNGGIASLPRSAKR